MIGIVRGIPAGYTAAVPTVGENVKRIRKARHWSQNEFADALGARQPAVSKIEKAATLPRTETLLKLANVLECSVDDLLAGVDAAYDARMQSLRSVQNSTAEESPPVRDSALPVYDHAEGMYGTLAAAAHLDTLTSERHQAVALAVALLRVLLGPAAEAASPDAAQSGRRQSR